MGVVYRAYDPPPMDRDVALKTLHAIADPLALELFYRECHVLKSISHPNVVEIFDVGAWDEDGQACPFFVMPLLHGQTLEEIIRTASHRLTIARVVDILAQTCRGLQAAHDHGLIHRDLKPSNIFVMPDDSVKIIDFGVAHDIELRSQSVAVAKGTLLYMSPEQVQHKPVTPQSDIFSLGVVCYEALTRRQPFRRPTEPQVVEAILGSIPPPASDVNPSVGQTISRVVHKAMAKQSWNRYDSAREFGDTLQKALRNEPIEIFDPARIRPRLRRATRALETGDHQFAGEIVSELEAEGTLDPELTLLRTQVDQVARQRTLAQLLESARARFDEDEDPLALHKIQEVLHLDPGNAAALGLKRKIEERRSERQIEQWIRLANQHLQNHSYGPARDALQNVLALRRADSRTARLLKQIEAEEQEYLKLRREKTALYESAVNAWKNGEVSHALSQMQLVLDLDRRAPDSTSREPGALYEAFYNTIRSEHDAINGAYAEARRSLVERDFAKANRICEECLSKYPGHALFQALTLDIEEQQRQQLSAFIAEVDRRIEAEADLDAKVSLLREAVTRYPDEPHFRRPLQLIEEKRDLVDSIVARARVREERGEISEALSDLEILQTIYSPYPGLRGEQARLRSLLAQRAREGARASIVAEVNQMIATGDYARALERIDGAERDFPGTGDWQSMRSRVAEAMDRARQSEQLVTDGRDLCARGEFDRGVDALTRALELDDRPDVRALLRDLLVERTQELVEIDVDAAQRLIDRAIALDTTDAKAQQLRTQIFTRRREREASAASGDAWSAAASAALSSGGPNIAATVVSERPVTGDKPVAPNAEGTVVLMPVAVPASPADGMRDATLPRPAAPSAPKTVSPTRARRAAMRRFGAVAASIAAIGAVAGALTVGTRARLQSRSSDVASMAAPQTAGVTRNIALETPTPATTLRISAPGFTGAEVRIDREVAGRIEEDRFAVDSLNPGEHVVEILDASPTKGSARRVSFVLTLDGATPPRVRDLVGVDANALIVGAHHGGLHVQSSATDVPIAIDGVTRGAAGSAGLDVDALSTGGHDLTYGIDHDVKTVPIAVGSGPTLDVLLSSDRNVGTLLVLADQDNASVIVDDGAYRGRTRRGEIRISNVSAGRHSVLVSKNGFIPVVRQMVDIRKGEDTALTIALAPIEHLATLVLDRVTPGADVSIDDVTVGTAAADGTFSYRGIAIGTHTVALARAGHEPWHVTREFAADQTISLSNIKLQPTVVAATKPVATAPGVTGVELFDSPASWGEKDGWFSRKGGGFALYRSAAPAGRFSFALKQSHSWLPFANRKSASIVVGYVDPRNYTLLQFDEKNYYRTEVVNGERKQPARVAHGISDKIDAVYVSIGLTGNVLDVQVSADGRAWERLDQKPARGLVDGRFGFYLPGDDEVRIAHFEVHAIGS